MSTTKKSKPADYCLQVKIPIDLATQMKSFIGKNYQTYSLKFLTEKALREFLNKHDRKEK